MVTGLGGLMERSSAAHIYTPGGNRAPEGSLAVVGFKMRFLRFPAYVWCLKILSRQARSDEMARVRRADLSVTPRAEYKHQSQKDKQVFRLI